ncbi:motility associated factor glycosyltransferase family protein [Bacillus sp. FJAT-45037]|uniref:motility associated factor glycosyltransferase family protein n=1 Tax=Bacillus sp. FJAT-45037 TaxID=2011007 RepID=UPI000C248621|nr:6-hydroxymethylpterin diphosphokinase MptE-like protein [Bacillus sp. FJAT-45037]
MVLIENINYLKKHFPEVRKVTKEQYKHNNVKVIKSKRDLSTLAIEDNGRTLYLHSKYDPVQEAEKFVEQYSEELSRKKNVFFYGIGLGYHVEAILKQYPDVSITLYEPNIGAFQSLINTKLIKNLGDKSIKHLFVETSEENRNQFLHNFASEVNNEVLLITLPSYERVFKEEYQNFAKVFTNEVKNKRSNLQTNFAYEKRWTINSLMNLKETIQTPNILHKENKHLFKGKPAIIVAAGPSLNEELDYLRHIKENGLAYIFSVGSAINSLVEYGIYPDAACTYDPQSHNHEVFEKTINKQADWEIPMIYGTSVGFETIQNYKGSKAHMITSQDTVSPYFYQQDKLKELVKVSDAPSIAVVATELLNRLECNPIIFVGQNFAYLNNSHYAKGIEYEGKSNAIPEKVLEKSITVENVQGEFILTNEGFLKMKTQMERVIEAFQKINNCTFINTTQGGAKINGTKFLSLQQVIEHELTRKQIVIKWYDFLEEPCDPYEFMSKRRKMDESLNKLIGVLDQLKQIIKHIKKLTAVQSFHSMNNLFNKFDKVYNKLNNLDFYRVFILPMIRVQNELVAKQVEEFRFERDTIRKAEEMVRAFSNYFNHIEQDLEMIVPIYNNVMAEIEQESKEK